MKKAKISVSQAITKFSTIDVLINKAGHGFREAPKEPSITEARQPFEYNFSIISV